MKDFSCAVKSAAHSDHGIIFIMMMMTTMMMMMKVLFFIIFLGDDNDDNDITDLDEYLAAYSTPVSLCVHFLTVAKSPLQRLSQLQFVFVFVFVSSTEENYFHLYLYPHCGKQAATIIITIITCNLYQKL